MQVLRTRSIFILLFQWGLGPGSLPEQPGDDPDCASCNPTGRAAEQPAGAGIRSRACGPRSSWQFSDFSVRASRRYWFNPSNALENVGFRCARGAGE
jgi:formylglycine-generating enzyme required for sulfatase activity